MKLLTGSVLYVGLLGVVEIIPLIIFGLLGGALADTVDKRTMILWTEAVMLLGTLGLFVNAKLSHPQVWVLFAVAAVFASADGLQRPSLDSIVPRLVPHDQLIAASSLSTFRWTFGSIIGPIAGGTVAVAIGPAAWYAVDAATFAVTLICFLTLAASPPLVRRAAEPRAPLRRRSATPSAVATSSGPTSSTSPRCSSRSRSRCSPSSPRATTRRSPSGSSTRGCRSARSWRRSPRDGPRGSTITAERSSWRRCSGVSRSRPSDSPNGLTLAVLALVAAGAADAISGIFRQTMWNASIPDEMRGRMAGLELLSYSTGPELGQLRSALVASATSLKTSVVSGGLLCAGSCAAFAVLLPTMWRFDASTRRERRSWCAPSAPGSRARRLPEARPHCMGRLPAPAYHRLRVDRRRGRRRSTPHSS